MSAFATNLWRMGGGVGAESVSDTTSDEKDRGSSTHAGKTRRRKRCARRVARRDSSARRVAATSTTRRRRESRGGDVEDAPRARRASRRVVDVTAIGRGRHFLVYIPASSARVGTGTHRASSTCASMRFGGATTAKDASGAVAVVGVCGAMHMVFDVCVRSARCAL
jgi:hypothetical protein